MNTIVIGAEINLRNKAPTWLLVRKLGLTTTDWRNANDLLVRLAHESSLPLPRVGFSGDALSRSVRLGGLGLGDKPAQPVGDAFGERLFLAGQATAPNPYTAPVHGACQSGRCAAREILSGL